MAIMINYVRHDAKVLEIDHDLKVDFTDYYIIDRRGVMSPT